jgi:hypothetical protein
MNRVAAFLVCLLLAASNADAAWRACAGMAQPSAHGCCGLRIDSDRSGEADCCALSQRPDSGGPTETRFAPAPATSIVTAAQSAYVVLVDAMVLNLPLRVPVRHSSPIYLRCSALLI